VTRLGIIARCDEGGLGAQTWEYARHLSPDVVLLLAVEPNRGEFRPERFQGLAPQLLAAAYPSRPGSSDSAWRMLAESCDVILTAETAYHAELPQLCAEAGTRLLIHANPELWEYPRGPGSLPITAWAPTSWMVDRLPEATPVVPMPVDRERCAWRPVDEVRRLLFVGGPAMLDRNGQQLLRQAVPQCRTAFELLVSGSDAPDESVQFNGQITVRGTPSVRDYWRLYDDVDALVLPRRYGGLSLPMQEAAACGLPVISLDVPPQREWLAPGLACPTTSARSALMRGGHFPVFQARPKDLAYTIDRLVAGETLEEGLQASEEQAAHLDWAEWEGRWTAALRIDG